MKFLIISISLLIIAAPMTAVFAQEDAGILPSNPFYFIKEWGQGIKRIFTFNPVKKIDLELKFIDSKIAELKKIQEISPNNIDALSRALKKYESNANRLKSQIIALKEDSRNPNIDRLLNELFDRFLRHEQLFDDLRAKFEFQADFKGALDKVQEILGEIIAVVPGRLEKADEFRRRMEVVIEKQTNELKELRAAEIFDYFENKLNQESRVEILKLKEDLLVKFSGRLEGQFLSGTSQSLLPVLEQAPGDQLKRLKVLDEVRETVVNPDLKSQLNVVRQRILEKAQATGAINSQKAEEAISLAEKLFTELETKISLEEGEVSNSVKQLRERGKFNLGQANELFKYTNYGGAYGQATAAAATLKSALTQMAVMVQDHSQTSTDLKERFDDLLGKAEDLGLTAEKNPKLFELFSQGEKKIAEFSKLIVSNPKSEKIIANLKNIKLILATIEQLIEIEAAK